MRRLKLIYLKTQIKLVKFHMVLINCVKQLSIGSLNLMKRVQNYE